MGFGRGFGQGFGQGYGRGRGYGYGRGIGAGRGEFSGFSCVKFVFFGFNVIFWLLGCAILGIGIWLQVSKSTYTSLSPSLSFISPTVLCIIAGILVLVVGFFGCCGAIMENKCLLMTYFVLVIIIFVLEIVVGVLAFIYRIDIEKGVGAELYKGIRDRYPKPDSNVDVDNLRAGWKFIQESLQCCGVYNYSDWYEISAWPDKKQVPYDCCVMNTTDCNTKGTWHPKGCLSEILIAIRRHLYIIGIVAICIGVVQILGLVASMALFCCLRQDKYYE